MIDKSELKPLLAWQVDIDNITCIVFAPTVAKARLVAVKGYWEAGYGEGPGMWPNPKARRASHLDMCCLKDQGQKCWVPSHAETMNASINRDERSQE